MEDFKKFMWVTENAGNNTKVLTQGGAKVGL